MRELWAEESVCLCGLSWREQQACRDCQRGTARVQKNRSSAGGNGVPTAILRYRDEIGRRGSRKSTDHLLPVGAAGDMV